MKTLQDIKKDRELIDSIDWDMTPEEAITLYLEWGNNWSHGRRIISKDDSSLYFVLNTWGERPVIFLVWRNSDGATELAMFFPPDELIDRLTARHKGVYAVEGKVKNWLREELDAA